MLFKEFPEKYDEKFNIKMLKICKIFQTVGLGTIGQSEGPSGFYLLPWPNKFK